MTDPGEVDTDGPLATVVVIAWNGATMIGDCLDALARQHVEGGFVTWVVDNASSDDTTSIVARHPLAPKLVALPRNTGFAGAAALAVERIDTPIGVLLNQDTAVAPGWLAALTKPLTSDPSVAAVTSKVLLTRDGRINNTGVLVARDGYGRDRGLGDPDDGRYATPDDVFAFSGTACALRLSAVREVGSFDPSFFLYYEDTDLSWRLQLAGRRIVYAPDAVVRHQHAASSDVRSKAFAFYNERNRLMMLVKCAPIFLVVKEILRFAAITALLPIRRARGGDIPSGHQFDVALRARVLGSFAARIPALMRKRRAVGRASRRRRRDVERELPG